MSSKEHVYLEQMTFGTPKLKMLSQIEMDHKDV